MADDIEFIDFDAVDQLEKSYLQQKNAQSGQNGSFTSSNPTENNNFRPNFGNNNSMFNKPQPNINNHTVSSGNDSSAQMQWSYLNKKSQPAHNGNVQSNNINTMGNNNLPFANSGFTYPNSNTPDSANVPSYVVPNMKIHWNSPSPRGRGRGGRPKNATVAINAFDVKFKVKGKNTQKTPKGRGRGRPPKAQDVDESFPDEDGPEEPFNGNDLRMQNDMDDEQGENPTTSNNNEDEILNLASIPVPIDSEPPLHDPDTVGTWIYPTNFAMRDYQFNIVKKALFYNTLVRLPTGLGKTFIAAVVMYNYYRWFPHSKVVFMAPTKPLVAQQIEACHKVFGIDPADMSEMTGHVNPTERKKEWANKRVFFVTPHILVNDMKKESCPANSIVCLVVDEAHRATGNYSYCQVIRELLASTRHFRVLALSASPGKDTKLVQSVINNLLIAHLEIRTEEDLDVRQYVHHTKLETIVISLSAQIVQVKNLFMEVLKIPTERLVNLRAFYERNPEKVSAFQLIKARENFRARPDRVSDPAQCAFIEGNFSFAVSLYSAWKVLNTHGLAAFKTSIENIHKQALTGATKMRKDFVLRNPDWHQLIQLLQQVTDQGNNHPKLAKLEELLLEHFGEAQEDTRAIVFVQFRDSVNEIAALLEKHQPLIKAVPFVGQASGSRGDSKGMTQKQQIGVIKEFRQGIHNTLIATCIGEEGLDIGEVDLIICFDAQASPTRMVQRMGRTGRKREGRCVMLLTEGTEENIYKKSKSKNASVVKTMIDRQYTAFKFYDANPYLLPDGIKPEITYVNLASSKAFESNNSFKDKKRKKLILDPMGFLNPEQLQYYDAHFRLSPVEAMKTTPLCVETFTKDQVIATPIGSVAHNSLTHALINSLQFIQDHQFDNEDFYGQEMALYFREEDLEEPLKKVPKKTSVPKPPQNLDDSMIIMENTSENAPPKKASKLKPLYEDNEPHESINAMVAKKFPPPRNDDDILNWDFRTGSSQPIPPSKATESTDLVQTPVVQTASIQTPKPTAPSVPSVTQKKSQAEAHGNTPLVQTPVIWALPTPAPSISLTESLDYSLGSDRVAEEPDDNFDLPIPIEELFPIDEDSESQNPFADFTPSVQAPPAKVTQFKSCVPVIPSPPVWTQPPVVNDQPISYPEPIQKAIEPSQPQPPVLQAPQISQAPKKPQIHETTTTSRSEDYQLPRNTNTTKTTSNHPQPISQPQANAPQPIMQPVPFKVAAIQPQQQDEEEQESMDLDMGTSQLLQQTPKVSFQVTPAPTPSPAVQTAVHSLKSSSASKYFSTTQQQFPKTSVPTFKLDVSPPSNNNSNSNSPPSNQPVLTSPALSKFAPSKSSSPKQSSPVSSPPQSPFKKGYLDYLHRGPPPNKGKKQIPQGVPDCLLGSTWIVTGVLDSLEREEATSIIKQYGGRVITNVSSKLTHALVGTQAGPKKLEQFKQMPSLCILDEDKFLTMLKDSNNGPVIDESLREKELTKKQTKEVDEQGNPQPKKKTPSKRKVVDDENGIQTPSKSSKAKKASVSCPMCQKSFPDDKSLEVHVEEHYSGMDFDFDIEQLEAAAMQKSNMNQPQQNSPKPSAFVAVRPPHPVPQVQLPSPQQEKPKPAQAQQQKKLQLKPSEPAKPIQNQVSNNNNKKKNDADISLDFELSSTPVKPVQKLKRLKKAAEISKEVHKENSGKPNNIAKQNISNSNNNNNHNDSVEWEGDLLHVVNDNMYYGAIIFREELYQVGDTVEIQTSFNVKNNQRSFIGKIETMYQDGKNNLAMGGFKMYIRPEQSHVGRLSSHAENEVFLCKDFLQTFPLKTLVRKCSVVSLSKKQKVPEHDFFYKLEYSMKQKKFVDLGDKNWFHKTKSSHLNPFLDMEAREDRSKERDSELVNFDDEDPLNDNYKVDNSFVVDDEEERSFEEDEDHEIGNLTQDFIADQTPQEKSPSKMFGIYRESLRSSQSPAKKIFPDSAKKANPNRYKMVYRPATPPSDTSILDSSVTDTPNGLESPSVSPISSPKFVSPIQSPSPMAPSKQSAPSATLNLVKKKLEFPKQVTTPSFSLGVKFMNKQPSPNPKRDAPAARKFVLPTFNNNNNNNKTSTDKFKKFAFKQNQTNSQDVPHFDLGVDFSQGFGTSQSTKSKV